MGTGLNSRSLFNQPAEHNFKNQSENPNVNHPDPDIALANCIIVLLYVQQCRHFFVVITKDTFVITTLNCNIARNIHESLKRS